MATVYFPSGWTDRTGGLESVVIDAPRVHELMLSLAARYPGLAEGLKQISVAIDGEIYQDASYQPLRADSEIHLVPRIAGGA